MRSSRSFLAAGVLVAGVAAALSGCGAGAPAASGAPAVSSAEPPTVAEPPSVVEFAAAYPAYSSAKQIVEEADLVVRVRPVSSRVEKLMPVKIDSTDPLINPQAGVPADQAAQVTPVVVTVFTVKVVDVVKGTARPGDLIEVSQLGGQVDGVRYVEHETTTLSTTAGHDYVLMLAAHGAGKPYDLLNPVQAMYTVNRKGALKPVSTESALPVASLKELRKLGD